MQGKASALPSPSAMTLQAGQAINHVQFCLAGFRNDSYQPDEQRNVFRGSLRLRAIENKMVKDCRVARTSPLDVKVQHTQCSGLRSNLRLLYLDLQGHHAP